MPITHDICQPNFSCVTGGIRAASFINSPLLKKRRRVSRELLHITDWYATILALAGGQPEDAIDGKNAWGHLSENATSPRKELLLNIDDMVYQNSGIRDGKWKLIFQERMLTFFSELFCII